MPDRPLLKLPDPEPFIPPGRPRGGSDIVRPSRDRQRARLDPRFERLEHVANDPQQILALRNDPASIAPERAIVFEIEGSIEDFYAQARALGLEYLGDFEDEFEPTEDFYRRDRPESALTGRIYLAMPDVQSLRELLSLWRRFKNNERMPTGKGPWRDLFSRLIDVRPWGPQDRVPLETIIAWREDLERAPSEPVRFEVELWFHENAARRTTAFERLAAEVEDAGGEIKDHAVIPGIHYDGVLVDIPAAQIRILIDNPSIGLARTDEVMFLRPQSVGEYPSTDFEGSDGPTSAETPSFISVEPIAALLDGLPIENHVRLAGRLRVDDPEGLADTYPVQRRVHGTEMASLIVNGDLNYAEAPLPRPLYVRPVLEPTASGDERTPADKLLIDVIHQAVRRMKEGDGDQPPAAPQVLLVNLSIGDDHRRFARVMSPLGRLLDYLAWRYRVLFLVSAGNVKDRLTVSDFATWSDFEDATPEEREKAVLAALNAHKSQRTLLSPAESMNALTIGAAHCGSAYNGNFPAGRVDPFTDEGLPNIVSAMGLGFKKVVKPELLFAGGRAPVLMAASGGPLVVMPPYSGARFFGLKTARPSPVGGDRFEDFTWGTSPATALATRTAHRIHDVLLDQAEHQLEVRFAMDSALEQRGFELAVPPRPAGGATTFELHPAMLRRPAE